MLWFLEREAFTGLRWVTIWAETMAEFNPLVMRKWMWLK